MQNARERITLKLRLRKLDSFRSRHRHWWVHDGVDEQMLNVSEAIVKFAHDYSGLLPGDVSMLHYNYLSMTYSKISFLISPHSVAVHDDAEDPTIFELFRLDALLEFIKQRLPCRKVKS